MARYRKIDVRMWGDERFRRLSPIPPCGQGLFLYLLTAPETGNVPGLYRAGEAGLSEGLGWDLEAFREAFGEAFRQGLVKADWKARVLWVPKAIKYNVPESPNVVISWRTAWDEIPECDLKAEAHRTLESFLEGLTEGYREAFAKACPKPSPQPLANQEQEQEQEQEEAFAASPPAGPVPADLQAAWNAHAPPLPKWQAMTPKRTASAKARLREHGLPGLVAIIERIAASPFCLGQTDRGTWKADPEWFLKPDSIVKVLEGKYDNRRPNAVVQTGAAYQPWKAD